MSVPNNIKRIGLIILVSLLPVRVFGFDLSRLTEFMQSEGIRPAAPVVLEDYFYPLQVGNQWNYDKLTGGIPSTLNLTVGNPIPIFAGDTFLGDAYTMMYTEFENIGTFTWTDYWNIGAGGEIQLFGFDEDAIEYRLNPIIEFPPMLDIGQVVGSNTEVYVNGLATGTRIQFKAVVLGLASVTVPAGTFNDCIVFASLSRDPSGTYVSVSWSARGVGEVKMMDVFNGTEQTQLTSYSIGVN